MAGATALGATALDAGNNCVAVVETAFAAGGFVAAGALLRIDAGGGIATGGADIAGGADGLGGSTEPVPPFFNSSRTLLVPLRAAPPMT